MHRVYRDASSIEVQKGGISFIVHGLVLVSDLMKSDPLY